MTSGDVGRVLRSIRGHFWIEVDHETAHASARESIARGARRSNAIVIGDLVDFSWVDRASGEARITGVHPRRTFLSRKVADRGPRSVSREDVVAANVDTVIIVSSSRRPDLRSELIDHYLVAAARGRLEPVICINKVDLDQAESARMGEIYRALGYPVVYTCAKTGKGLVDLSGLMRSKISVLAGQSGVGKSSLLKALIPGIEVKTAEVSDRSGLGRHTTTTPELTGLPGGGYVIDTPGIRHFTLWQIEPRDVREAFVEIHAAGARCRFNDCSHSHEPDCAVLEAVSEGSIHPERYRNFIALQQECVAGSAVFE
ncbi:MAG: ribosome small subunit-dependent GTPase A [Acidobacteria bacterium]|nr:ribosome small subunit-dependent GTPase A [Acidobacteriota bacterium]